MSWGTMGVDWETRVDYDRLRAYRLSRAKEQLEKHKIGAYLCFDFNNIRYITSTHIGEWARDKMHRYAVLPRGGLPILRRAVHHGRGHLAQGEGRHGRGPPALWL